MPRLSRSFAQHTERRPKLFRRAENYFYLRSGNDHRSDSLRMPTLANKAVEARDVTCEATLRAGVPSPPLPEMREQGETRELGEAPEPGGTDDFTSAATTPLPVLGRRIRHQLRAVSPMTQAGDDLRAEGVELNDLSAISSDSSDSDTSSRDGSDASSSDDGAPTSTAARTAARQERTCQDRVMVKTFSRREQERRPRSLIRKRLRG